MLIPKQPQSGHGHPSKVRKRQYPPRRNCLNYAFLMQQLLAMLNDPFNCHINLLNALLNCPAYGIESERFIRETGTNYSVYLSNMLMDKRNATSELIGYMKKGLIYRGRLIVPDAEGFQKVAESEWSINKGDERAFRKSILDCLVEDSWKREEDQQNWHLTADMIEEIRDLAEGPDSNFFQLVFVTVKYAIIRKNNAAYRGVNSSEFTSVILEARHAVDLMPTGLLTAFEHDDAED